MTKFKIRISEGNRKMGLIPSVSLPPIITCVDDVPCAKEVAEDGTPLCYVVANMIRGPYGKQISKSYAANLELLNHSRFEFFDQLQTWLQRKKPELFRFHVSGDFIDLDHLTWAIATAKANPSVGFLSFTKNHAILPPARMIPRNFSLVASMWPGWGRRPRGYRCAWLDDGTDTRIPASTLRCPGNCETCGMCWELRRLKRDVRFKAH